MTSSTTIERLLTLSNSQHRLTIPLEYLLIGNGLELARSTNKFLPNLTGKLINSEKVAYTEAKAHRDLEYSTVIRRGSKVIESSCCIQITNNVPHEPCEAVVVGSS